MFQSSLAVGLGGCIGAVLRFLLSSSVVTLFGPLWLPLGTLAVNVIGGCTIGFCLGLGERFNGLPLELRLFMTTGMLGGFTTFSAFSSETISFFRKGESWLGAGNVLMNVAGSLGATVLGILLSRGFR